MEQSTVEKVSEDASAVADGDNAPVKEPSTDLVTAVEADAGAEDETVEAPDDLIAEEQRLLEERKQAQAEPQPAKTETLTDEKFSQLDILLDQTDLYSKFLAEQMGQLQETIRAPGDNQGEEPEEEEEPTPVKGKRKAGGGAKGKGKKAKTAPTQTKTKQMLPLFTGGEMREYQLKGVSWLISLYQNGLNGILADQMGLGKTVQVIGFLSHMRHKGIWGPFLVIGPLSTLPNWVNEFERWCPDFPKVLYHGNQQERAEIRAKHMPLGTVDRTFPVVCTSYEIVIRDRKFLQQYNWKYLVVDEGHRLKNFDCRLIRELNTIRFDNKLLLSGTPLQNNLAELWSLLHFILPDVFGDLAQFQSWFDFPIEDTDNKDMKMQEAERRNRVVSKLHQILRPFLLRRIKSDVETSLPRKKEIILYAQMNEKQLEFSRALIDKTMDTVLAKMNTNGKTNLPQINNVIMQLRKNCNHPDLITSQVDQSLEYPSPEELVEQCGKFKLLDRLLTRLKARGHKVLIFSQMTRMLDIIESYLQQKGEQPCRIDGSVSWQDRQQMMHDYNTKPEIFCFLLSTRAGGLGINLVSADTCIIYDSDWNPHQDMQAMDRCHRIGQTKPVHVYRLATAHSVEGRMLKRANSKLKLEQVIITGGNFKLQEEGGASSSLSAAELVNLLKQDVAEDGEPQSGDISDNMLEKVLDRSDMLNKTTNRVEPYTSGIGFEVVDDKSSSTLLSGVQ